MTDVMLFEDIEIWATTYLRSLLGTNVFIGRKVPATRRDYMVTVQRIGGVTQSKVSDAPRLGVNVYAPDDAKANDLAAKVRAFMGASAGGDIKKADTTGFYEVEDKSGQPRRYFTADFIVRGKKEAF